MSRWHRAARDVALCVLAAVVGACVAWLADEGGWTRLVGVLALVSSVVVFVVLDARRERRR